MGTAGPRGGLHALSRAGLLVAALLASALFVHPLTLFVVAPAGIYWLVRWHARHTVYVCPHCRNRFAVSLKTDFLSPNMVTSKLLRCPQCGRADWCEAATARSIPGSGNGAVPAARTAQPDAPGPLDAGGTTRSTFFQIGAVQLVYLVLWIVTICLYRTLPERIPTHFNLALEPDHWSSRSEFFIPPLIAAVFPLLHAVILSFAARQGYRSWIYPFLTAVFVMTILAFLGVQILIFTAARQASPAPFPPFASPG